MYKNYIFDLYQNLLLECSFLNPYNLYFYNELMQKIRDALDGDMSTALYIKLAVSLASRRKSDLLAFGKKQTHGHVRLLRPTTSCSMRKNLPFRTHTTLTFT